MAKQGWLKKAVGEISKLRQSIFGQFGTILAGRWNVPYVLNSSRVEYELARQLYHNTHNDYKLGSRVCEAYHKHVGWIHGCAKVPV